MSVPRPTLSPDDWALVRSLFERCQELDPIPRARMLEAETRGRSHVRAEVESLLAQPTAKDSFLGKPLLNRMQPVIPERLGKYLLLQRLGRGGMAEVFLAKMLGPGGFHRLVAVKCVLPEFAGNSQFRRLFEHEAKLGSRLSHANIAHVYDFAEVEGTCLLAMEFVNGKNLASVLSQAALAGKKVPVDIALYICAQLTNGLDYAHSLRDESTQQPLQIAHRDVSPKNIMTSFSGEIKIVDFGIAQAQEKVTLLKTGNLVGTIDYLSPEVAAGKTVDWRSDIFSATAVLYELLSGEKLFQGESMLAVLKATQTCQIPKQKITALPVDRDLKKVIRQALEKDPEKRLTSAGALRDALQQSLAGNFPPGAPARLASFLQSLFAEEIEKRKQFLSLAPDSVPVAKAPSRRKWLGATLGLMLALIAGFAGFHFYSPKPVVRELSAKETVSPVQGQDPCSKDTALFCPGKKWRSGLGRCLKRVEEKISPECRERVRNGPLVRNCGPDMRRLCSGNADIRLCLRKHLSELSENCRSFLK